FEIIELNQPRRTASGQLMPAGAVLLGCQAYDDDDGPNACTQDAVIAALGLWTCDLYPGSGDEVFFPLSAVPPFIHGLGSRPPQTAEDIAYWEKLTTRFVAAIRSPQHEGRLGQLADELGVPVAALEQ